MKSSQISTLLNIVVLFLGSLILFGCNSQTPEATTDIPPSVTPGLIATTIQTSTPEEQPPTPFLTQSLVVLVAPEEAESTSTDELSSMLSELAAAEGLDFEQRISFTRDDLSPEIRILVATTPDPGLSEMAQSAPATQFLGILIPGLEVASNLTVIDNQVIRPDYVGFLAGYLAAVVTPEWRVGTISVSDSTEGIDHRRGFLNGAVFFCGLCRQIYPPYFNYPLYGEAPSASSPQEWQISADTLIQSAVKTAYVAPGAGDVSLLEYLANAEINLIGTTPPPPGLQERWIATITGDIQSAVHAAWPSLIAGQGGASLAAPLTITNINPDLFSPGRQHLVEKLIGELSTGFIDTGVRSDSSSP